MASLIIGLLYKFYIVATVLGNQLDWNHLLNSMVDPIVAWSTFVYLLSWPMLFVGIYMCGKEGVKAAERYTKYLTYHHYHEAAKEQMGIAAKKTRKAVKKGKRKAKKILKGE